MSSRTVPGLLWVTVQLIAGKEAQGAEEPDDAHAQNIKLSEEQGLWWEKLQDDFKETIESKKGNPIVFFQKAHP